MKINKETCINCGKCMVYCPVNAIKRVDRQVNIDFDECVECGVCKRSKVCPTDSIYLQELTYPRTIRSLMSDVLTVAVESQISGRGTEEMKKNEVTGRFPDGWVGVAVELGRPGIATYMSDVEKVAMAVAKLGVEFEIENPITSMMTDKTTGKFRDELLPERVLSAIIEFPIRTERLEEVLLVLKEVAEEVETVFSVDVASKVDKDGNVPHEAVVKKMGLWASPNAKTNVGLGRPLYKG